MSLRTDLIRALAQELDEEPFQPRYHKKPHGNPVTGWGERLSSYFWPKPEVDYAYTFQLMDPWFSEAGTLSQQLVDNGCWTQTERTQARDLAWLMLKWGGVTRQKLFSEATVEAVFRRALGLQTAVPVPMNSGWTKVAALATAYLEGGSGQQPHAIWDSRVSTSLVTRLERLLVSKEHGDPKLVFPKIGAVLGRGGTRPRIVTLKWSHARLLLSATRDSAGALKELQVGLAAAAVNITVLPFDPAQAVYPEQVGSSTAPLTFEGLMLYEANPQALGRYAEHVAPKPSLTEHQPSTTAVVMIHFASL